ncbi:MAG: phage major capsid protein [Thiobacillus sp.]|uniref:phage major capsid protein n=1 Tax=Thiobacillus sp. TaxID=924 RepID=UPI002895FCAE|nr:phage major capsid protein [Thiobacillus sp.]MDT3706496.1 phage major capsid protein [Thiobacillus sp.]
MPEIVTRQIAFRVADATGDAIPCTVSSEEPCDRGSFVEILSHDPGHVDLRRAPLPLIVQHDHHQLNIGVVDDLHIAGGKLKGVARFGSAELAQQILKDVKAGIVRNLSVGYQLLDTIKQAGRAATFSWQPYEVSVVSVPADTQAGFYRSHSSSKGNTMPEINIDSPADHQSRSQRRSSNHAALEERERVQEIAAIGHAHKMQNEANRAIAEGTSLDAFRSFVLANLRASGTLRPSESPDIGLSQREAERFSFQRAILAQMDPNYARREAGFELEASRALAEKLGKEPQGLFVPNEVLRHQRNQRDLVTGTPGAGGYLVANELDAGSFIEMLRARSHVLTLGATTLGGLVGNLSIPSQTGAATAYWLAEDGAPTESQQVFGQVPLTPKTVGAFTDFSRRMLLQATPDIEALIRADLAALMAVEVDRAAIAGTGANNQPTGILSTSGIGAVAIGADGGPVTWAHVLQLEEALANASADMGAMAYLTNAKVRRALKGTTKVSGDAGAGFIWSDEARDADGFGWMNGYKSAVSSNVPSNLTKGTGTNLSAMIFGNWQDLMIGQWGGLDLMVDKITNGTSGGTRVIALLDVDVAVRRAASFAAIVDATTL